MILKYSETDYSNSVLTPGVKKGIILIHGLFLGSFSFVNTILKLILAKVNLIGVLLSSRHVSFWTLLDCMNHS